VHLEEVGRHQQEVLHLEDKDLEQHLRPVEDKDQLLCRVLEEEDKNREQVELGMSRVLEEEDRNQQEGLGSLEQCPEEEDRGQYYQRKEVLWAQSVDQVEEASCQ